MTAALTDADRAVADGLELVGIVRDYGRDTIEEWVRDKDRLTLEQITVALAAMVPDDVPVSQLLAWCDYDLRERRLAQLRRLAGKAAKVAECGTRSGFGRHKARKEEPCEACRLAERVYQRNRKRERSRKPEQVAA